MNYNEKEERIQKLYANFKLTQPHLNEFMKEFFEIFSDDIYAFPIRFYNLDDDEAGDFYLYAFEHLKDGKKLSQYEGKSRFTTWLFAVLRNLTIDFLRSQKNKVKLAQAVRLDSTGNLVDSLLLSQRELPEEELVQRFQQGLSELKVKDRLLFKLAYLHYFELTPDELAYLAEKTQKTPEAVFCDIVKLKELAQQKANAVREIEDKLTANFNAIMALESKIDAFFKENPQIPRETHKWDENYFAKEIPLSVLENIHSLAKKKKKQAVLLLQQKRSLACVRLPYREISELLNVSQSILSVQLARILERLSQQVLKKE